jgi:hypothetical protein
MTHASPWANARAASDFLGVSEKTLFRWRSLGIFEAGLHYRRKFPSLNSPVLYHLPLCQEAMATSMKSTPETTP